PASLPECSPYPSAHQPRPRSVPPRLLLVGGQSHIRTMSACRTRCSILSLRALGDSGVACSYLLECRSLRTFAWSRAALCIAWDRLLGDTDTRLEDQCREIRLGRRRLLECRLV